MPDPPDGFDWRDVWYDLTPLRPDEFGMQMAGAWTRAEQIQAAFRAGCEASDARHQRAEANQKKADQSLKELKQRTG